MSCTKRDGPIWTIYTSYDVILREEMPFGGCGDCIYVKILVALICFNRDWFLDLTALYFIVAVHVVAALFSWGLIFRRSWDLHASWFRDNCLCSDFVNFVLHVLTQPPWRELLDVELSVKYCSQTSNIVLSY